MPTILNCRPLITDEEIPEGEPCVIYEDGEGTAWFIVNRAALLADPEAVVLALVGHCNAVSTCYDRQLLQSAVA